MQHSNASECACAFADHSVPCPCTAPALSVHRRRNYSITTNMSYLKSMEKAKEYNDKPHKVLEAGGGLDLLIGSPPPGNASEP